jgi:cytochrome c553
MNALRRSLALAILCVLAIVIAACTDSPEARSGGSNPQAANYMRDHFSQAVAIRDALIAGDLEGMREPAGWIAEHEPPADWPEGWAPHTEEIRSAARAVLEATDRGTASRAVASLALACGACHQALGSEVEFTAGAPPEVRPGTMAHMERHMWAADRMWKGLVGRTGEVWFAGAAVMSDAPLRPSILSEEALVYDRIEALAERVHSLGAEGRSAEDPEDRADIYAGILATCARCHQLLTPSIR